MSAREATKTDLRTAGPLAPKPPSTKTIERLQQWELTLLEKAATQMSVEVIPPFRAIPGRSGELVGFNYALPVDPLDERLPAGIDALWARRRAPGRAVADRVQRGNLA